MWRLRQCFAAWGRLTCSVLDAEGVPKQLTWGESAKGSVLANEFGSLTLPWPPKKLHRCQKKHKVTDEHTKWRAGRIRAVWKASSSFVSEKPLLSSHRVPPSLSSLSQQQEQLPSYFLLLGPSVSSSPLTALRPCRAVQEWVSLGLHTAAVSVLCKHSNTFSPIPRRQGSVFPSWKCTLI